MIKLFAIAIIAAVISSLLKRTAEDFLLPFNLFSGTVLLLILFKEGAEYLTVFNSFLGDFSEGTQLITGLVKASVIALITKLSCNVCSESGNLLIEDIVELGGRIMIFIVSLPYIIDILGVVLSFID